MRSNGKNVLIERIRAIDAPERNLVVEANALTSRESIFTNSIRNIPGNTLANAASLVYLNGADNLVENSVFFNGGPAVSNSGGDEVHATNSRVRRNRFVNLYPAIYEVSEMGGWRKIIRYSVIHSRISEAGFTPSTCTKAGKSQIIYLATRSCRRTRSTARSFSAAERRANILSVKFLP